VKYGRQGARRSPLPVRTVPADPAKRLLTRDGAPIALMPIACSKTPLVLVRDPGRTVTKDELHDAIWPGRYIEESSLEQAIFTLRKILSGDTDDTQEERWVRLHRPQRSPVPN
jgi:DNA-binding winged helix-turn-helix (wHTH) protein